MDDTRKVIAATDKAFGRVDAVINAAGITDRGTIWDTKPELFDAMMNVNVRAPYFIIQDALHVMKREKTKGTIVNIISMSGHGGQDFISAYCISKGALITLTKNTAYSVMRHQIRVNGLTIGWMDTPGEDRIMKTYHDAQDGWLKKAEAARPFGRLLKPDEVARACGLSVERGVGPDDRCHHRFRPAGCGHGQFHPGAAGGLISAAAHFGYRHGQRHGQREGCRHGAEAFEICFGHFEPGFGQ